MKTRTQKQKTIHYKDNKYVGILKSGKVRVYVERTARGQHILAGILNLGTRLWENESKGTPLPMEVRHTFEETFA